jgi:multiple sugar transport system permease protein
LTNSDLYPLSVGVFEFRGARALDWPMVMAASTIFTIPLVVLFFILQRYFLKGVALTGIKG